MVVERGYNSQLPDHCMLGHGVFSCCTFLLEFKDQNCCFSFRRYKSAKMFPAAVHIELGMDHFHPIQELILISKLQNFLDNGFLMQIPAGRLPGDHHLFRAKKKGGMSHLSFGFLVKVSAPYMGQRAFGSMKRWHTLSICYTGLRGLKLLDGQL